MKINQLLKNYIRKEIVFDYNLNYEHDTTDDCLHNLTINVYFDYDETPYEYNRKYPNEINVKIREGAYSADFATRFRRNPPPCSGAKRHGVPVESATPDRSVATLDF